MAWSIEFDFDTRVEKRIAIGDVRSSIDEGKRCWVDIDLDETTDAAAVLQDFGLPASVVLEAADRDSVGRHDVHGPRAARHRRRPATRGRSVDQRRRSI